jgi:hypothetical protein
MEALGGYAEALLAARAESWPWIARINPRQDRHSARAIGQLTKTGTHNDRNGPLCSMVRT